MGVNIFIRHLILLIMLYIAILPYMFVLAEVLADKALIIYGRLFFGKTYIQSINTPTYSKTEDVLLEFNSMGDNLAVKFGEIENGRPITVEEMTVLDELMFGEAIGLAIPKLTRCTIKIRKGLSKLTFRETLIHEYLHCFGYMHVDDSKDLMYYALNPIDKEENIRQYAKRVKREFYE